ncbi:MAG: phosphotransferase [Tabrizicola sp.]|nr:phosphotransferase [Tabrizicola sp.]
MRPDDLRPLLPLYGVPREAPLRLLNQSENATWMAGADQLVLRVHRHGYHRKEEIASELCWLQALQGVDGLRCVAPVPDKAGTVLQEQAGRFVVAFQPIPGREVQVADDLHGWFGALGEISARLHLQARNWARPPGFTRKRWDVETILGPDPHWGRWRDAPGLDPAGAAVLDRLAADLAHRLWAYGTAPGRFGLIHADLRLANLMIDQGSLWAIDFDDCGFGWWMYDLAAAVSFIETDPRLPDLMALWCEGYARIAPLAAEDRAVLPVMVMLRRVLLTAWIGSRADSDTAQALGGPDYTAGTVMLADRFLAKGRLWS